jgi:hypothetical protein
MNLKQWLKRGRMGETDTGMGCLVGAIPLSEATDGDDGFNSVIWGTKRSPGDWFIDVLDDGTAITYCIDE